MKVIINNCFGGFGLSQKAFELYDQRTGTTRLQYQFRTSYRDDPIMVSVVEELGTEANDIFSSLEIVTIPDNYDYEIDEYDGLEQIILRIREDYLRELIRLGNEDDIIDYVKKTQGVYDYEMEDEE